MNSKLIVNTGTLYAGGAERVLSVLSTPFANAFDEVQYVMWLDARYPEIFYTIDPRVKIVRMSRESGTTSIWRQMLWYRKYIKKETPDLVLSFMVMICLTVTISLFFTGIKQIVAERNDPRHTKQRWLRKIINLSYFAPDVKGIIMQTEWNKSFFKNKKLFNKTSVIYNPVSIERKYLGAALDADKDNTIVSVGRLTRQKQYTTLIKAFAKFSTRNPLYKLIIYGEGEMRYQIEQQVLELGLERKVLLPGRSSRVVSDILSARMFVISSEYEGMSNALAEAMCVGLPCISTKVSGATDLIQEGENGFLVEVGDVDGMAEKMALLADNKDLANIIASKATRIHELLDEECVSSQWTKYLKEIISV